MIFNYLKIKRVIDIFSSFILAFMFIIPCLFIYLSILIINNVNPIFLQERSGLNKITFKLIKFQTFKNGKITRLGFFLRQYKIDEIPQLINIIKGDLSLIGPRPLLTSYNTYYSSFQNKRFEVMPGLTGLAQIKLINTNNWRHKFIYDNFYANKISFKLDLLIIFYTLVLLIKILFSRIKIIEDHTPLI